MQFPLWAVFGLVSATLSTGVMMTPERAKLPGFVMAFWNKVAVAVFALPFVLYFGAPSDPVFYGWLIGQAAIWAISDVIFFGAVPVVGAGVISRIMPISVIVTFFAWFFVDPTSLDKYLATPVLSAGVLMALLASVYFALRLKKCAVSWAALRMVWFVLFASVAGPIAQKMSIGHSVAADGPFAFALFEALAMVAMWLGYYALRRPVLAEQMFNMPAVKAGFTVGVFSFLMVVSNVTALKLVDNPGLLPAVKFTDSFIILLIYKMIGRKEDSDVLAGVGIVLCAAAIIILKSF